MSKKKLILTRGIQGSGKTYFAKAWVAEDPENRVRINNDDIRNMLGVYWVTEREPLVSEMKQYLTQAAMDRGYDIVIDNMNLNPKEVAFWKKVVISMKLNLRISLFHWKNVFAETQLVLIQLVRK